MKKAKSYLACQSLCIQKAVIIFQLLFFEPPLTIVYCAFQLFRTCDTKEETVSWSIDESPFLVAQLQI